MKTALWPWLLLVFLMLARPLRASAKTPGTTPPATSSAQYVGSDTCLSCHEEVYKKQFEGTPHFQTVKNGHGCESCHGPGLEHVEGGGDKSKIVSFAALSRAASSRRCLECHGEDVAQRHTGASAHLSNQVGCVDCHSPHHGQPAEHLLARKEPELCYSCHASARAEFARPYHHRVNEGLVQCTDCHSVHGASTLRQVRETRGGDAACFRCHSEKQGPFVYEHLPVKTEGCSMPHAPWLHQSAPVARQPGQLALSAVPFLPGAWSFRASS